MMYDELVGELYLVASNVQSPRRKNMLVQAADAIEELQAEIERLKNERRWISVTERLPKTFDDVIVCRSGTRVMPGRLDNNGWWKVFGTRTKHVTHWMPLPEPPEEDE